MAAGSSGKALVRSPTVLLMGEIRFAPLMKHLRSQRYAAIKRIQKKAKVRSASVSVMILGDEKTTMMSNQRYAKTETDAVSTYTCWQWKVLAGGELCLAGLVLG